MAVKLKDLNGRRDVHAHEYNKRKSAEDLSVTTSTYVNRAPRIGRFPE
jgi:hypothetical protein